MKSNIHTFVICAYKESKYLEECIKSLVNQTVKSEIIMVTSTPNDLIGNLAKKYNIKLIINTGKSGIGEDWNFGVFNATTPLVTVAHQDDIYEENYLEEVLNVYNKDKECSIIFGDYREIKNGKIEKLTRNLKIKRTLLKGLLKRPSSKKAKERTVKYGNAICCPCVTLNTDVVGNKPYEVGMKSNLDWYTWYKFSKLSNPFGYVNKDLMYHRIHEESETSNLIGNNVRIEEDYKMLCVFWPKWVAKILMLFYKDAVKTNR